MDTKVKRQYVLLISMILIAGITISGCIDQKNNDNFSDNGGIVENVVVKSNNTTELQSYQEIRFIVVGDPHIKSSSSDRGNDRLKQIVNFADSSDVDFVVLLGDIADDGKNKTYDITIQILKNMTKPYYVVAGNHDVGSGPANFERYFGPMEHIENVKGYQLLFAGIYFEGKNKLHWSFDFNKTDKNKPTLVFLHGPTVKPPKDAVTCSWKVDFFGYGQTMQPELNTFPNLIAEYSGHVHYDTDQTINGVRYVTVNGLVDKAGGCENEGASDYVGYSVVKDGSGKADYILINYNEPFTNPFPING